MLGVIRGALATLFFWIIGLFIIFILFKISTFFVPGLSQDNIKNFFSLSKSSSTQNSFFHFPYPGEWENYKMPDPVKPILAPTIEDYNNKGKETTWKPMFEYPN